MDATRLRRAVRSVLGEMQAPGPAPAAAAAAPSAAAATLAEESVAGLWPDPAAARAIVAPAKIAVGSDHGGVELKDFLRDALRSQGYTVVDLGTHGSGSVDYPDYAFKVADLVARGQVRVGIIVDGVGIGSCMAANKLPGVRAAACYETFSARNSREHNAANVLCLGGRVIGSALAQDIVKNWLETPFGGGRHAKRVGKIVAIEQRFARGMARNA